MNLYLSYTLTIALYFHNYSHFRVPLTVAAVQVWSSRAGWLPWSSGLASAAVSTCFDWKRRQLCWIERTARGYSQLYLRGQGRDRPWSFWEFNSHCRSDDWCYLSSSPRVSIDTWISWPCASRGSLSTSDSLSVAAIPHLKSWNSFLFHLSEPNLAEY